MVWTAEEKTAYQKEYRQANKVHIAYRKKEYYDKHREQILEKKSDWGKIKIGCECGCYVRQDYLSKHMKSVKHSKNVPN